MFRGDLSCCIYSAFLVSWIDILQAWTVYYRVGESISPSKSDILGIAQGSESCSRGTR